MPKHVFKANRGGSVRNWIFQIMTKVPRFAVFCMNNTLPIVKTDLNMAVPIRT